MSHNLHVIVWFFLFKPGVDVTCRTQFDPNGDGKELWEDLFSDGRLQFTEG